MSSDEVICTVALLFKDQSGVQVETLNESPYLHDCCSSRAIRSEVCADSLRQRQEGDRCVSLLLPPPHTLWASAAFTMGVSTLLNGQFRRMYRKTPFSSDRDRNRGSLYLSVASQR